MDSATVVVADRDERVVRIVGEILEVDGYRVVGASNALEAIASIARTTPQFAVLAVGADNIDGVAVYVETRRERSLPVVFLADDESDVDEVLGLENSDCCTKPFTARELRTRVRTVLRAARAGNVDRALHIGRVTVDIGRHEVRVDGIGVALTATEFAVMRCLAERRGLIVSREQLLADVWDSSWLGRSRAIDVHVAQIRKKLGEAAAISTVRGVGYRLERS